MNILRTLCTIAAIATTASLSADSVKVESLKKDFARVHALELPARGAAAVAAAPSAGRQALADDVIRAAFEVDASTGPQLVAAIARATPELAAGSAATAALLQPGQLSPITKAAVSVAPAQTEAIVNSLVKGSPKSFATIGIAAVEVAPKSAEAILAGIASANATLKALISRVDTQTPRTQSAAVTVLKRTETLLVKLANSSRTTPEAILASDLTPAMTAQLTSHTATVLSTPPVVGPPYTLGSPSPGELNTAQTYEAAPVVKPSSP